MHSLILILMTHTGGVGSSGSEEVFNIWFSNDGIYFIPVKFLSCVTWVFDFTVLAGKLMRGYSNNAWVNFDDVTPVLANS